jgi:hypothetical protein
MDEIIARIIELRTVRDAAHAEICELEKRLELLAEFADTPAAPALRDVFAKRDRARREGAGNGGRGK